MGNHEPLASWKIQEGAMVAPHLDPKAVCRELAGLNVVAEIDWYPPTPHLLGLNVLINGSGGVAALDSEDAPYRVGTTVEDMCRHLARTFRAEVQIGDTTVSDIPADATFPKVDDSEHTVRAVEVTSTAASSLPFVAAAEGRDLGFLELGEGQRAVFYELPDKDYVVGAMSTGTPSVGFFVSDCDAQLVSVPTGGQADAESITIHSWTMLTRIVAGGISPVSEALSKRVRADLGHLENPQIVAGLVKGADGEALAEAFAMTGREGLIEALKALQVPAVLASYLYGHIEIDQVPGSEVCPSKGLRKVLGSTVDILLSEDQQNRSRMWRMYRKAYVDRPWVGRGVALAEAGVAAGLITVFARGSDARSVWHKLAGVGGGMLLADSVMGVSVGAYLSDRLRRLSEKREQGKDTN